MVLHTWGQRLPHHPHIHGVVPAGGLAPRSGAVDPCAADLLSSGDGAAPGLSGDSRRRAPRCVSGATPLVSGRLTGAGPRVGVSHLAPIAASPIVGGLREAALWQSRPRAALPGALHPPRRHLESPAVAVTDETVTFRRKDYRHGSQVLNADARRRRFSPCFSLHVLPKRFVRIRYFGLLAPRCRPADFATCRAVLSWWRRRHRPRRPPPSRGRGRVRVVAPRCASSNDSRRDNSSSPRSWPIFIQSMVY